MEELEPCPYCGCETAAMHGGADNSTMMYWVSCLSCGARGGRAFSKDDAAKKWNRRAAPENKALTCDGCEHKGKYEDEYEYGYPSPCTGCKRRSVDYYARKPQK